MSRFIDPTTDFGFKKIRAITAQFSAINGWQTLQAYLPKQPEGNNA